MHCQICGRESNKSLLCPMHQKTHIIIENGIILRKSIKSLSKPEKLILTLLKKENIKAIPEVYFPWCRESVYRPRLPFDIYIPKKRIIIEYDGQQHFKYVKFFHKTRRGYLKARYRDRLKEILAAKHDLKVIRLNYKQTITKELILEFLVREHG